MLLKELLDMLEEVVKKSVEDEVNECDTKVQKLYNASKEFISKDLTKLSDNDLDMALAISKSLTATIKFAFNAKKEKEKEDEE